jgi:DNA-directed RNA polymerase subunit M/transcription elongation factor TFIIS
MTSTDNIQRIFPHIRSLDIEFYELEPYKSNRLRRCKALVLHGAFSNYPPFREMAHIEQNNVVKRIEAGCVNSTIKKSREDNISCSWETQTFVNRYNNMIHDKANEIDYANNTWLVPRILSGEINPFTVGTLSYEECNPAHNRAIQAAIEARKNSVVRTKPSEMYECPQCLKKLCTVMTLQLRGLDEAKTTVYICNYCDHEWSDGA